MAILSVDEGEVRVRDVVCKICVCGIATLIIMRRGGYGDGGAEAGSGVSGKGALGRWIILWFCVVISVSWLCVVGWCNKSYLMPFPQPSLRVVAYDMW